MNWISVDDALPELTHGFNGRKEYSEDVIIYDGSSIGVGLYTNWLNRPEWKSYMEYETGYYGDAIHPCDICYAKVTHWMPLPEPPK